MSYPTLDTLSQFVDLISEETSAVKKLVDPDCQVTLARITPILGGLHNVTTLGVISRFLTELLFENVPATDESYIVLSGVRLPLSSFRILDQLTNVPPLVLRRLAETMASCSTDVVFPDAFVDLHEFFGNGRSDIHVLVEHQFEPMVREAILKFSMNVIDEHRQASGALTSPVSGDEHASS